MLKEGYRVAIIRARHGWHDGRTEGIIKTAYIKNRRSTQSFIVKGDDGELYEVEHERDLILKVGE